MKRPQRPIAVATLGEVGVFQVSVYRDEANCSLFDISKPELTVVVDGDLDRQIAWMNSSNSPSSM